MRRLSTHADGTPFAFLLTGVSAVPRAHHALGADGPAPVGADPVSARRERVDPGGT